MGLTDASYRSTLAYFRNAPNGQPASTDASKRRREAKP